MASGAQAELEVIAARLRRAIGALGPRHVDETAVVKAPPGDVGPADA
jgi:hypothetical protein